MRIRITIDIHDAEDSDALEIGMPFTLNVYKDDEDGIPSQKPLTIGSESCLVGGSVVTMLEELSRSWGVDAVFDQTGSPLPSAGEQWRDYEARQASPCDECDEQPASHFWSNLPTPVQLCDSCLHNARRSGWELGA